MPKIDCPSCRAAILVDDKGNPVGEDAAHFDLHEPEPAAPEPAEPAAPAEAVPASPPDMSFLGRVDRNLTRLLNGG